MQSGIHRAAYLRYDTEETFNEPLSSRAVRGIGTDSLNQVF